MYRLLKQYRSTGFYKVKIEDFREDFIYSKQLPNERHRQAGTQANQK